MAIVQTDNKLEKHKTRYLGMLIRKFIFKVQNTRNDTGQSVQAKLFGTALKLSFAS